ncbi:MAG: ferritin-like domain-containing protein [Proteobacteria bacterium]|nr:ferritin-like domain-containing protein [Pseudomonadota bacterium]
MSAEPTLRGAALEVLSAAEPARKLALTRTHAQRWQLGEISAIGVEQPPDRPARPARPELLAPARMPKRSKGSAAGRAAFVHAIAHIEFNAIDLAWDIVARFHDEPMPRRFFDDWVATALDEAEHFALLAARLTELGHAYGDLPAHDGLWQAALETTDDLMARLALVPMVLEARGLDTAPVAADKLRQQGDIETSRLLARIGAEEVPHVAAGVRWFEYLAKRCGLNPHQAFHKIVRSRLQGSLKPPFNVEARLAAGLTPEYFLPLVKSSDPSPMP